MQFGTPMFLSGEQFGGLAAPMCAETLEEFKRRLGSRSPTQEDAMRYLMVSTAVQEALTPPDMEKYRQAILLMKGPAANAGRASAENSIQEIERKILGGTEREKAKTWRDNYGESVSGLRPLNVGTPVRLKSDATRHGVVDDEWKVSGVACEYLLNVRFSGGAGGGGVAESVRRDLLVTLCSGAGCAHDADKLRCAGCRNTFYCSAGCQKRDWKSHKPACQETQRTREGQGAGTPGR